VGWAINGYCALRGRLENVAEPAAAHVRVQLPGKDPITAFLTPPDSDEEAQQSISWIAHLDVSDLPAGAVMMTVLANVRRDSVVFRKQVSIDPLPKVPVTMDGKLDQPAHGSEMRGDVLAVRGWCLFADSHVARVEVFVDGKSRGLARLYVPRPDIVHGSSHRDASVPGFEALINMEGHSMHGSSHIRVEATSLDGRQWTSLTHRVDWIESSFEPEDISELEHAALRSREALASLRTEKSKVIVFTHDLGYGGGQLWLLELLRHLVDNAGLTCLVISVADGPLRVVLERMGIEVHVTAPWDVTSPMQYEGRVHELAMLIRHNDGGVVLANTLGMFAAIDAAERAGIPSMWAIHESFDFATFCFILWGADGLHPQIRDKFKRTLQLPKALVFEATKTELLFAPLRQDHPSFVIDYGVDLDEIDAYRNSCDRSQLRAAAGFEDEDIVVVVVGTFEPRKAQALVVAAFDELSVVHSRLHLVLVGRRPDFYSEHLDIQIRRTRGRGRIHVVDVSPEIYPWYELADVLVCSSDVESLPRSILEALAFELPVVSTDVFGISDLIDDGSTGWLTRADDLEGLVGLMEWVLTRTQEERIEVARTAQRLAHDRHGDRSYGYQFASALKALLKDPEVDLRAVISVGHVEVA
jgi:D-inositol-3-phosphate glycosyltransferase